MAGLVGNPLLVHVVVNTRQDAHHLASTRIDPNGRAEAVHDVDRFGLGEFPRPILQRPWLGGERADGAEIDDVPLQLGTHRVLEIGGDLHVLAAADGPEIGDARDLSDEAHAARAVNAAIHRGLDERPEIFVLDGALVLVKARSVDPIGHRLVLQIALTALVADRAIERMVDEQKLHHAFTRLLHHRRLRIEHGRLAIGARTQIAHRHGTRSLRLGVALHLDEAHAAIAGDRQPFMEAEARDLRAAGLAGLQQRIFGGDIDLPGLDDQLGHSQLAMMFCSRASTSCTTAGEGLPLSDTIPLKSFGSTATSPPFKASPSLRFAAAARSLSTCMLLFTMSRISLRRTWT